MKHLLCALLLLNCAYSGFSQTFILEKLPESINSQYDEITPVPSRDGSKLYFTRVAFPVFDPTLILDSIDIMDSFPKDVYDERLSWVYGQLSGTGRVQHPASSPFNQDIWVSSYDGKNFTQPDHPGYPLNNVLPNSLVSITPDPNAFYIINQFFQNGDMKRGFSRIRRNADLEWEFPSPVNIDKYYTITSEVNLTMSFDGEILIISCRRADSRDMDLYVCFRKDRNNWSEPQHLGNVLNSPRRETTPYLSEDNRTLFFSSNRNGGGNDIFMSTRLDESWKSWSSPVRLTSPINSSGDDSQPYFNMSTGYIYFTSNRDGNSDIFRVKFAPAQPTEIVIKGRILNRKTGKLIENAELDYESKWTPMNTIACPDGTFTFSIPKGIAFTLTPHMPGFAGSTDTFMLRRDYVYFREQYVDIYMDPLEKDSKIELRPIYFQQSKAIILDKSKSELNRLAQTLRENPGIHIRIEGHTDNVGKPEDLQRLSRERADAIRDYLMDNGIGKERMEAIGHGAKFPINSNESEEMRAQNRRVEVYITRV